MLKCQNAALKRENLKLQRKLQSSSSDEGPGAEDTVTAVVSLASSRPSWANSNIWKLEQSLWALLRVLFGVDELGEVEGGHDLLADDHHRPRPVGGDSAVVHYRDRFVPTQAIDTHRRRRRASQGGNVPECHVVST